MHIDYNNKFNQDILVQLKPCNDKIRQNAALQIYANDKPRCPLCNKIFKEYVPCFPGQNNYHNNYNRNKEKKFHAIVVTDCKADNIEEGVKTDYKNIQKIIKKIAKYTDLTLNATTFKGKKNDVKNLINHINDLKVESDDVIFFYFSGHGLQYKKDKKDWPYLSFGTSSQMVDYGEIVQKLESKNARLTLLFSDCCNNKMSKNDAPELIKLNRKNEKINNINLKAKNDNEKCKNNIDETHLKAIYNKLFIEPKGLLAVTSSQPGKYSYSSDKGGNFTVALKHSLKKMDKYDENKIDWQFLLTKLCKKLNRIPGKQEPIVYNLISSKR